jgi:probable phosphoglycerate mutase
MLNPTEFLFLRHGETDWNAHGLSQGRVDIPLNATGVAQAEAAGAALRGQGVSRIVASTLGRARRTAEIVGAALAMPFETDADLQEASFGDQEGKPMGGWYDSWVVGDFTPPGGEPFSHLQARVVAAVNRAVSPPGLTLIVAHGAMFRAARAAMGLSALVRTDNGVVLRCTPGQPWTLSPVV